jgi:hypothetical protein
VTGDVRTLMLATVQVRKQMDALADSKKEERSCADSNCDLEYKLLDSRIYPVCKPLHHRAR